MATEPQAPGPGSTRPQHPSDTDPQPGSFDAAPDLTGWTLEGRYQVEATIGRGGMGAVYRARQLTLDRPVALKIIKPEFAQREMYLGRFLREAKVSSKIQHPNVVQIMDFGQLPGGSVYFVMELLEGETLGALIKRRGRLVWNEVRDIARQVVRGLGAAHRRGVVHRDVKPGNVFLVHSPDPGFRVKVLDFGIAKVVEQSDEEGLTSTNEVLGTAAYMAPEQAFARNVDARTDVYAVGILIYKMLTGTIPFKGESAFETLTMHVNHPPTPMRELVSGVPQQVEAVVAKALAKQPGDRFQSMEEFEAALTAAWDSSPGPPFPARASGSTSQSHGVGDTELEQTALTQPRKRTRVGAWVGVAIGIAAVATFGAWYAFGGNAGTETPTTTAPVVVASPSPAVAAEPEPEPEPEAREPKPEPTAVAAPPPAPPDPAVAETPTPAVAAPEPKPKPKTKTKPKTKPKPKRAAPKPAGPSDQTVKRGLAKSIRSRCAGKADGTRLEIRFSILSTGKPSVPRALPPHRSSPLGKCAAKVVAGANFPAGKLRAGKITIDF